MSVTVSPKMDIMLIMTVIESPVIAYASFAPRRTLTCLGSGIILTNVSHHPASKYEPSTYVLLVRGKNN